MKCLPSDICCFNGVIRQKKSKFQHSEITFIITRQLIYVNLRRKRAIDSNNNESDIRFKMKMLTI